jgi:hypothetical protein
MKQGKMSTDREIKKSVEEMEVYISRFSGGSKEDCALDAIREFKEEWINTSAYCCDLDGQPDTLCETCLIIYTHFLCLQDGGPQEKLEQIERFSYKFDNQQGKSPANKYRIYHNIGLCFLCHGEEDKALKAFKKSIFFLLQYGLKSSQLPDTAYKFTKCSNHLLKALKKQELILSPPQSFNDPFDCPIQELLNHDEKASQMIRKAYHECLTVSCFSSNSGNKLGEVCDKREPHLNELMWAHYADSHRGICIQYRFSPANPPFISQQEGCHICFLPIEYSDGNLAKYSAGKKESISLYDSFFLKGESWKYEKEVRLIKYDPEGKGKYASIPMEGHIEAVYFGLNCSSKDRKAIRDILADKTFIRYEYESSEENSYSQIVRLESGIAFTRQSGAQPRRIKKEVPILFYEMEKDPEYFGRIRVKNSVSLLWIQYFSSWSLCIKHWWSMIVEAYLQWAQL